MHPSDVRPGTRPPHVAVCVDNSRAHGRRILKGIANYVDAFGPWSLFLDPQSDSPYPEGRSKNWKGDGILTYIDTPARAERLQKSGIPTVELFGFRKDRKLPSVINDDLAIGTLAAEHLIDREFKHFAFAGYRGSLWSDKRKEGFAARVKDEPGSAFYQLEVVRPQTLPEWETVQGQLTKWIRSLPKPVGLMACSDNHAQRLLDACQRSGLNVPEEVAVIGVDNNEEVCRLSNPPLTSVIDDAERIGYEGARLLHQMMSGKVGKRNLEPILVPPLGINTRKSTDVTALEDRLVAEMVRYIRENACHGLSIKQMPSKFGISRSVLYRRFEKAMNRTPHEELLRAKIARAKTLLQQTEMPLETVAEVSGFQSAAYLSVAFKNKTAVSPSDYRRTVRRI